MPSSHAAQALKNNGYTGTQGAAKTWAALELAYQQETANMLALAAFHQSHGIRRQANILASRAASRLGVPFLAPGCLVDSDVDPEICTLDDPQHRKELHPE